MLGTVWGIEKDLGVGFRVGALVGGFEGDDGSGVEYDGDYVG